MDTLECIKKRRSIREFKDTPVEFEKIINILDAGRQAPSAGNLQSWRFVTVLDLNARNKIAEACFEQMWMSKARVHIVVCADLKKIETFYEDKKEIYASQGCAAAAENMLLAAHAQGLGGCWIGAFNESIIMQIIEIPEDIKVECIIALGYPAEKPSVSKIPLENLVFFDKWNNRIRKTDWSALRKYYINNVAKAVKKALEFAKK